MPLPFVSDARVLALAALALALGACQPAPRPAAPPAAEPRVAAPPAPVASPIVAAYREAADVFEILDNVSRWLPDKCDPEYREAWERRFGLGPDDERRFTEYRAVRERHYVSTPKPAGEAAVFAVAKPADRLAHAFYEASSLADAYERFGAFGTPADVDVVRRFHEAYRAPLAALLAESRAYAGFAASLNERLGDPRVAAHLQRLAAFHGVTDLPRFTVLYVWWPPVESITANNRGSTLLLKYHPVQHRDDALRDVDIPVHELAHFISQRQPEAQKQALARVFLAGCEPPAALAGPRLLEEPLAVAHQKVFLAALDPGRFDHVGKWYGDPWVSALAKLLHPAVQRAFESGGRLDEKLVKAAAKSCRELLAVGKMLAPRP